MDIDLQVGCKILIGDGNGKYLLVHRSPIKYPNVRGRWDIVGGRITPGAPLFENLVREVNEETGLILEEQPQLIAAQDILHVPGKHVVRLTYVGRASGNIKLDISENDKFRWFSIEEILKMDDLDKFFAELVPRIATGFRNTST